MPAWPTQSDYKDALQNPDTAFRDPEMRATRAETSPMGVPRARSGAFASVYKMSRGPKVVALKLFNFPNEDRASRYRAVSDYLKKLGSRKPAALVGFEYHTEGIRVGRAWYPTLTMDWVKGKSLGEWVREAMERKKPDTDAVRKMADSWVRLVQEIQASQIAHGDLQHDNVMVVGDTPVLVDYDGMCVPTLADPKKPLDQLEFGKPAYQHPARPAEKLGPHLDHFAAWVILVALRASAADPSLYTRFVTKTENENLLFTPPDMETPAGSRLWPELLKCKDPEVREWAHALRQSLDRDFDAIPPFNFKPKDPFAKLRALLDAVPRDWKAVAAEKAVVAKGGHAIPPELQAEFSRRLRNLCNAARMDYPAVAAEAAGMALAREPVPPDLKPIADDAAKRVNARDAVQKALAARDPRTVRAAFDKSLLEGWADKRLISEAEAASAQILLLDRLKAAVAVPGDGRALVKLWTDEGFRIAGLPEAEGYQREATRWAARIAAAEEFIRLFNARAGEKALAEAWEKVAAVGPHPDITPEQRLRGEQAALRAPALARLAAVPSIASYKNDAALVAAWGDGTALAGCKEADIYTGRVKAARERVNKVLALKSAIDAAEIGAGSEKAVVEAGKLIPPGYEHPYVNRITLGASSVEALETLAAAVNAENPSDRAIAAAVDLLRTTNRDLLARLDKVDPRLAAEAAAAGRRRKILNEFAELDTKYEHPHRRDRKWRDLWNTHKELLRGRRDTEELRERLTLAKFRLDACEAILKALEARDLFRLRELHRKHVELFRDYKPLLKRKPELDELLARADRVIDIQHRLKSPGSAFLDEDLKFMRDQPELFRDKDRAAATERVRAKLGEEAMLHAGQPPVRIVPAGKGVAVVGCWSWPAAGLVSHCLVAVDETRFFDTPTQAERNSLLKCVLRDYTAEGGGKRVSPFGATRLYLTVWAVAELGWATVYGPPLHLGPAVIGG
jgi:hypothetical protein